ncbi:prolipoprotein diacylglyceryl transferase family protein [Streptomyces sp. NPDC006385]|uniref:prolipoprotein diacylglyceryl transferase family protein n=1 Tax=Streptomyces sp. NPDC006385 TaxID=3156761 RepID=UPI0033A2EBBB
MEPTEFIEPAESVEQSREVLGARAAGGGCAGLIAEAEPQGLGATYWFDAAPSAAPYSVTIRFTGTRIGTEGKPGSGDRFEQVERVSGITEGMGRIAVTARVQQGINAGTWRVTATPAVQVGEGTPASDSAPRPASLPRTVTTTTTRLFPLVHGPGARPFVWPSLVGLGVAVAIAVQAALLARTNVNVVAAILISLAACVMGYLAAKFYYLALHRKHPRHFVTAGTCIQGFLVGAVGTLGIAAAVFQLPVGTFLDATTPGLFFGMAVGRPGCFFGGCCAGRPTDARWGLWSSDRRLGIRRHPVQLVEAAVALVLGAGALALTLTVEVPVGGTVFIGAVAAYTFIRQLLFPLRAESRTPRGRALTMAICAVVVAAALAVSVAA